MPEQRSSFVILDDRDDIQERLALERARLRREAGLSTPSHFKKPRGGALERKSVTTSRFFLAVSPGGMRS